MSDIKLFRLNNGSAVELQARASDLEKPLQTLIEKNLEAFLGIRFVATEYSTGRTHGGRIDTLGFDENFCPVIIEYKRSSGENVINQGLFYLDWLMDHQAEFKLLVIERFGNETSEQIDWSSPRVLCIASDFTKYDAHAVQQIGKNIELLRYRLFGSEFLVFELVNSPIETRPSASVTPHAAVPRVASNWEPDWIEFWERMPASAQELNQALDEFLLSLGDDVQKKFLKQYIAYKRLRNFVTVQPYKDGRFLVFLHLDPETVEIDTDWMRDVREIGHWGTGDLEISVRYPEQIQQLKPLIERAYGGT
ncbi:MAG: DUF5655 domain-containing protein [Fimbriimonadaceae bacterium]